MVDGNDEMSFQFWQWLVSLHLDITHRQLMQFRQYANLLVEWNKTRNLTSIVDDAGIYVKHFYDSAFLATVLADFKPVVRIMDLGTGAGLPGIPLKIIFPEMKLTLCDSLRKRTDFLAFVVNELELKDVAVIHSRAEDLARDPIHREAYSHVVSRAVAHMPTLLEWTFPFVRVNAHLFAMKGPAAQTEWKDSARAAGVLHANFEKMYTYELPLQMGERQILVISKEARLSNKFPRKPGEASRNPLV